MHSTQYFDTLVSGYHDTYVYLECSGTQVLDKYIAAAITMIDCESGRSGGQPYLGPAEPGAPPKISMNGCRTPGALSTK